MKYRREGRLEEMLCSLGIFWMCVNVGLWAYEDFFWPIRVLYGISHWFAPEVFKPWSFPEPLISSLPIWMMLYILNLVIWGMGVGGILHVGHIVLLSSRTHEALNHASTGMVRGGLLRWRNRH